MDFPKTEEARKLFQVVTRVHGPSVRPFFFRRAQPKSGFRFLRKAYMDTMKDPEFWPTTRRRNWISILLTAQAGAKRQEIFELRAR